MNNVEYTRPKPRERAIEDATTRWALEFYGIKSLKFTPAGQTGWPDRIFLLPITPLWIEFKRLGEEPTKLQYYNLDYLRSIGYSAIWTDCLEGAKEAIRTHLGNKRIVIQ